MARGHNPRERCLFRDLGEKNLLSAELRRVANSMRRWQIRMHKKRSKRWQARYRNSLRRAAARLENLQTEVLSRAEELKLRIGEELKISVDEVQQFEEQYKKEVQELRVAQQELQEAQQALVIKAEAGRAEHFGDTQQTVLVLSELQRKHRRAELRARSEAKDVKAVEEEIASEATDKEVLTNELHRIIEEIQTLRHGIKTPSA